jgi:transposase InsO family protein
MCHLLQVSCSGYYAFFNQQKSTHDLLDDKLILAVKALHQQSDCSYGSRRIAKGLQAQGYRVCRYKARRLMRKAQVSCKQRRRFKVTTQSKHGLPVAANYLNRQFKVTVPSQAWVADITFIWTKEGWLYLAAVLDLFSRRVVGWALADHMQGTLVHEALLMALGRRQPAHGLMHHSDRGSQYASKHYQRLLAERGIAVSMSRKGNCWDNSVMERFFGSLKSERTNQKYYFTRKEAKADIIEYIEMFYNSRRLHSTLGYVSPVQFEVMNQHLFNNVSIFTGPEHSINQRRKN